MSNKLFIFLLIPFTPALIISLYHLVPSFLQYHDYPDQEQPSVLTDTPTKKVEPEVTLAKTPTTFEEVKITPTTIAKTNKDYILPSDTKKLYESDLLDFDYETLNRAYNEIFARYGHDFDTKSLEDYFTSKSWYKKIDGKKVSLSELSKLEQENLTTIKERIDKIK